MSIQVQGSNHKPAATQLTAKVGSEVAPVKTLEVDSLPEGAMKSPSRHHCIIAPARPSDKTDGGVILPESSKEASDYAAQIGRIEAVGPFFYNRKGFESIKEEDRPKVGDYVLFAPYTGRRILIEKMKFLIIADTDILVDGINPDFDYHLYT